MITRILLVDDSEPWPDWLCSELTVHSLQISEAADGLEAVQKARELKPDLILPDLGLPDMSGLKVARQIRQAGIASKIVFLTLGRDTEARSAAIATGAGYVLKTHASPSDSCTEMQISDVFSSCGVETSKSEYGGKQ